MEIKLPIKRLNRLNLLLAIVASVIVYIILAHSSIQTHEFIFAAFTFICIELIGYTNIVVMIILAGNVTLRSRKFTQLRLLFTYPASVAVYLLLWPICARMANHPWSFQDAGLFLAFVGSGIVINTLIFILNDSVLLYEHKLRSDLELSRLKTANAEAANLLLKQQIQPHFLFNALNTLKALYHKDTDIADSYLVHMASFLRGSIYYHATTIATLDDEVKLLLAYLEMQRIRFGVALNCSVTLPDEIVKSYYLPSFSLQPLLENAIKHNDFTPCAPLKVNISYQDEWLVISNNLQKKKNKVASVNYGLANLAERYHLLSGDEIVIKEEQNLFSVSIKLLKDEYSNH